MTRAEALVLAGHGSQRHPESAAPLHAHADRIRDRGGFDEVRTAFWKEEPALRDVRSVVGSAVAVVVPMLTSEGYFADEVFPRELGVDDAKGTAGGPELRYTEPVGTHDAMTGVIEDRVESAVEGPADAVGVALVGHGTERNERSAEATEAHAARLARRDRYAEVTALFLDEEPFVGDVLDHLESTEIVVVPFFVADGHHTSRDVPDAMGHPGIGETTVIDGRTVHYTGAIGMEPSLTDVVVERARGAGAERRPNASAKRRTAATGAFVDWIDASSTGRRWGELVVVERPDGYEIANHADAESSRADLEPIDGPAALRGLVRSDDDGHYRPLSGARTLPTGWALSGLDADELVRSIRAVYPGSVAHWYQARTGTLDATDLDETVERQTGIYADLDGLDSDERASAVEAVCGNCVRDRRWKTHPGEAVEPQADDGAIPCREACPFLLSAAHAFRESDGEAAAEPDPAVPAGALSDPANEYRVRYARALAGRREADSAAPVSGGESR